ncbi:hypothetical protein [Marinobacter sp. F4216]|uniref:hypothetical protein n=1 Tax=Marinobacter sp. F4216 TaxID=2874281 RepID=UPI001CBB62BF|nr:hypothetical protein [Marinobacter sp. F4216]MBZ2167410.1 hypothetical protein [Marinobacter sp. F4216]
MTRLFTYSASLALLLAVSPSYGEYWEELAPEDSPMNEERMGTTNPVSFNPKGVENDRRIQLERGLYDEFDFESLPPTAAGSPDTDDSSMSTDMDWHLIEGNRRMQLERGLYQ